MASKMREALIRPSAIAHNVSVLKGLSSAPEALVVVKANGYGHGALTAARAAVEGGATWLGTADLDEAMELRSAGVTTPILAWLFGPDDDVSVAHEHSIDVGVSSVSQLAQVVGASHGSTPLRVHLKVDTGLARSGVVPGDWEEFFRAVARAQTSGRIEVVGMFSHLSGASPAADQAQGALFDQALEHASSHDISPALRHLSASAATTQLPSLSYDMVRLGISAYGYPANDDQLDLELRPAMRLSAQVVLTKKVPKGQGVGYGHTYVTSAVTTLALVPVGYADGIPRHASSSGPVAINGRHYTLSGRVSMDQFSVDVGGDDVRVGQWCVLWGDSSEGHPTVSQWAQAAETISYEIVSRVGPRVPRVLES